MSRASPLELLENTPSCHLKQNHTMNDSPESDLLEALRRWRYFEKRHAAVVLGELDIDKVRAKESADRALHQLRIVADKAITQTGKPKP